MSAKAYKSSTGGTDETTKHKSSTSATSTETFLPRGLANASNGAGAGLSKKTNGKSRGEADEYYGVSSTHPLTSTYGASNGGAYNASEHYATDPGGGGGSGMYNPTFPPSYSNQGASYSTNTIAPGPIQIPNMSGSTYNPTPVPQASPYYPTSAAGALGPTALGETALASTSHGENASYYGDHGAGTSVASSFGSTTANQQHQQQSSGIGHSLGATISAIASVVQNHQNNHDQSHNHNNPPPPLRQSIRKLWESLRAEERHAIGQFELYSEIIGCCAHCFTPGTTYLDAPRKHHYGQRWSKTKGWRVRKHKTSRRVWMRIFRRDISGANSPSSSSGSDSISSVSDSDLSDNTRERRKQEKRMLKRQERRHSRSSSNSSIFQSTGSAANKIWKNVAGGSGGESDHHYTKTSTKYSAPGVLRGGDLDKSKEKTIFYNPGYTSDGKAHPKYYNPYDNKQSSKSTSVLGSWFGSSSNSKKESKHKRTESRTSIASSSTSLPGQLFEVSASSSEVASDDALAYGPYSSSPSSLGSKKRTGWFFRPISKSAKSKSTSSLKQTKNKDKKTKGSSSFSSGSSSDSSHSASYSEDGMAYGYRKSSSLDSASLRSKQSYTGSVTESIKSAGSRVSSVFGIGKVSRRKSWDDYGTPSHGRGGSSAGFGMQRSNTTGGSRTKTTSITQASTTTTGGSSWWGGRARKSDGYSSSAVTNGKHTAASTQGGWFQGGDRKSGGWFGGSGGAKVSGSASLSTLNDSWQEDKIGDAKHRESYAYSIEGGETHHSSTGIRSHSTSDVTNTILKNKEKETYIQRQDSESQFYSTSMGDKASKGKDILIQRDPRAESPGRSSVMTGKSRRESSVDSWDSESRQSRSQHRKSSTVTQKTKTGFMGGWFSRNETHRSRSRSKEAQRRTKKMEELKEGRKSKSTSGAVYVTKKGEFIKEGSSGGASNTYIVGTPQEEEPMKIVYPTATDDPLRFDTRSAPSTSISRQQSQSGASYELESYTSEQRYHEYERQSSKATATATAIATATTTGEGTKVVVDGFQKLPTGEQQIRPLPAPVQPHIPAQLSTNTSTTTIIHNNNISQHTTSNINHNSSSNVTQNVMIVPLPAPRVVETSQSQSSTTGISSTMAEDIANSAARAVAAQVASVYAKERAEREEREKREIIQRERRDMGEKERQESIQRELLELRLKEERAALIQKEKAEQAEKERRALRLTIEQKEQEEIQLRLKREREERAATELKKKQEWEAAERAKDEAARESRKKQDEERREQIKLEELRKYREWCKQETLRRLQREREDDENFERMRKIEEERIREVESQHAIQKAAEEAERVEAEKRIKIEAELLQKKEEAKVAELRRIEISKKREHETNKIRQLEEERRAYVDTVSAAVSRQKSVHFEATSQIQQGQHSSIEVQRREFLKEQEREIQQARIVEEAQRRLFESQMHSTKREQQIVETQRVEISQELHRTTEKLSKLQQIVADAHGSRDESRVQQVQREIKFEQEKATKLRIEEEKKIAVQMQLRKEEELRAAELNRQIQDEKTSDAAKLIMSQKIVAADMDSKKWQQDEKVRQYNEQIRIEKEKETKLKMEEEMRIQQQMEQSRQKDEKTREYIAQVEVEQQKMKQVEVEQQRTVQVETDFQMRQQEESRRLTKQLLAEEERIKLRKMDEENGGSRESRRERQLRIESEQRIAAVEKERSEALKLEAIAKEEALERQRTEEWEKMTEEERIIHVEVQRRREIERKEEERIALEKKAEDLMRQIAEQKKQARRARSRARKQDPAYKEREAKRSRERSRIRESEGEKARRAEIEYVRKNAGLDKIEKKEKKKRYSTLDPLPTQDIPGFVERSWSVPGGVPTLIETPPSPPPGTPRYPQRLHCEGSYFPQTSQLLGQVPLVPAIPQIFVAEPEAIAAYEKSGEKTFAEATRQAEIIKTAPTSEFERRAQIATEAAMKAEAAAEAERRAVAMRSVSSSEFEGRTEQGSQISQRVEPVRAVTSSELERSSKGSTESVRRTETVRSMSSSEFERRTQKSSESLGRAESAQAVTETIVTGKPFVGTPVAPVPTVAAGFNIGATVIGYQQNDDSRQYSQVETQQKQGLQQYGQNQDLVYQGPQLPPGYSFQEPVSGSVDVYYGPELPQDYVFQPSSATQQISATSESGSHSSYERTSSEYSNQQKSAEVYGSQQYGQSQDLVYQGPQLPPNFTFQKAVSRSDSQFSYDRTSSDYTRQQTSSEVYGSQEYGQGQEQVYQGPQLPPNFTFQKAVSRSGSRSGSSHEQTSDYSHQQISSEVYGTQEYGKSQEQVYQGPELPPNFMFQKTLTRSDSQSSSSDYSRQQTSSGVYGSQQYGRSQEHVYQGPELPPNFTFKQATSRSDSQSSYEHTSSDYRRQQQSSDIVYGPPLPPVQQVAYQGTAVSSDRQSESRYQRSASDYSQGQKSQVVSAPVLPAVQTPHQSTYDDSTQSFRFPGAFDDEVAPEVIQQISREHQTASVPAYLPTLAEGKRSVSESASRLASSLSKEVRSDVVSREDQTPSLPVYRPALAGEQRSISESSRNIYSGSASQSQSSISKEVRTDVSRDNQTSSAVPTYRPALASEHRSISEASGNIYSAQSASRSASIDLKEASREGLTSSTSVYRPALAGEKRTFSDSATTLYSAESEARSTSSLSRDQDFQTPPTGGTHDSTPVQDLPYYRQQPSPPNVFAFQDEEAEVSPTPRSGGDSRPLTREQIDKNNEFMAIAAASAEQAGFPVGLVLGSDLASQTGTAAGSRDMTPTGRRSSIVRPRSAFIEEVEDEDIAKLKRQLGQHELPAEAYLSYAASQESKYRTESQSRTGSQSYSGLQSTNDSPMPFSPTVPRFEAGTAVQPIEHPLQPSGPNPPRALLEWNPAHIPMPQQTPSSVISAPKDFPPAHSAPPVSETMVQERRNRAHGVTRTGPPASRSASVSGSLRSKMDSVREDDDFERVERPAAAPRAASVAASFRSRMESARQDNASIAHSESSYGGASIGKDSGLGTEVGDFEQRLERKDSTRRGREPRNDEQEAEMRRLRKQREREEFERGSRGRGELGGQKGGSNDPRQTLQRSSTEQWSAGQPLDHDQLPRRSTDQWPVQQPSEAQSLQRRATDSAVRLHEEQQSSERHSRRSIDSVYNRLREGSVPEVGGDSEAESQKAETESLYKGKSKLPNVSKLGKIFSGWGSKSKVDPKSESAITGPPTRPNFGGSHRRSVSEAGVTRDRPTELTRNNTEEWEKVTVTPPQKSRTSSLRGVDLSMSYEKVDSDNMSTASAPVAYHDDPETYSPVGGDGFRKDFDTTLPQHVEDHMATVTSPEQAIPEPQERPALKSTKSKARTGFLRAARRFGVGSQTPPRTTEDKPVDIPSLVPLMRANAERTVSRPSSSGGASLHQDVRDEQRHVETTWSSARVAIDTEEQKVAEHVPLPTSAVEEKEPSYSRLPLSRAMSMKQKSAMSLRKEAGEEELGNDYRKQAESAEGTDRKSTSAMMLTLSEGVDLSSDVKEQQEDTQSSFYEDFPPSYENLPLDSPTSQLYSPIQYERIPDTFSFSPGPSPVLSSAAIDIYEQIPALPQSDLSSPYSPHSRSPDFQHTTSEHIPVHEGVIPSLPLDDLPRYVPAQVTGNVSPQWQAESSPNFHSPIPLAHESSITVADDLSLADIPPAVQDNRSATPENISVSPITKPQSSPTPLGDSSTHVAENLDDLPPLPPTESSSPIIQAQEPSITTPEAIPLPQSYPVLLEDRSLTPENPPISPIIEGLPVTSTPLSEPISTYHEPIIEDTPLTVDRYALSPIDEGQEVSEEVSSQLSYPSSPKALAEVSEELQNPPFPPVELQQTLAEQQLPEKQSSLSSSQSPSTDHVVLEGLPALSEPPIDEFQQPTQELSSALDILHELPALDSDEPEFQSHVESESSLDGLISTGVTKVAPEYSQNLLTKEPSSPPTLSLEQEVALSGLPQLETSFLFHDTSRFPQTAPSGPSPPKSLSPIGDESLSYATSDPVPDQKPTEQPVSRPVSPVLEQNSSSLPLSAPASPQTQFNMLENESVVEVVPPLSRSPSPQFHDLAPSSRTPTHEESKAPVEHPELLLSDPVSPYPTFEEPVRSVDSRSPSVAADHEDDNPISPTLTIVPNDLPQLPPSDPSSPYNLGESMYEFSDLPTSLSPILEASEPSRSPSILARDGSSTIQPMSSPASPDLSVTVPDIIEATQGESSSSVVLSPEGSSEIHPYTTEPEVVPSADAVSPTTTSSTLDGHWDTTFELPPLEQPLDHQLSTILPIGNLTALEVSTAASDDHPEQPQGEQIPPVVEQPLEESSEIPTVAPEPEVAPSVEEVSVTDLKELPFSGVSPSVLNSPLEQSQPTVEREVESTIDQAPSHIDNPHSDHEEITWSEPLSFNHGAQPEQSFETHSPPIEPESAPVEYPASPLALPATPTKVSGSPIEEETILNIPEFSLEQPTEYDMQYGVQAGHPIYTDIPQQEPGSQLAPGHSPVEGLSPTTEDILPEPDSVPLPEEISTSLVSSPVVPVELSVIEMPESDAELSASEPEPEFTFQAEDEPEYFSRRSSAHDAQLSPILEISEDSFTEPENLPLSEDLPTSPVLEEHISIETAETNPELPTGDSSLDYTLPGESEIESITRRFSIEGFQLSSDPISHADPVAEPESLPSHQDALNPVPLTFVEPTGFERPELDHVSFSHIPAEFQEVSPEAAAEFQQLENVEVTNQHIYDKLPPVEIESFIPDTEIESNKDIQILESNTESGGADVGEERETQGEERKSEEEEKDKQHDIELYGDTSQIEDSTVPPIQAPTDIEEPMDIPTVLEQADEDKTLEVEMASDIGKAVEPHQEEEFNTQEGVKLDTAVGVEEEEKITEQASDEKYEEPALEQDESSTMHPLSPTFEQPADQAEINTSDVNVITLPNTETEVSETIDVETESKHDEEDEEDESQEGVALQLPVATEDDLMGKDIVSIEEEETTPENIEREHTEEPVLSQPNSVVASQTPQHVEQFAEQVEPLSPTTGLVLVPGAEDQAEEIVADELESQKDIPVEVYNQEITPVPAVSAEEASVEEESVTKEQNDIVPVTSDQEFQEPTLEQEPLQTSPTSPKFEYSADPFEVAPLSIPLPETEIESAKGEDHNPISEDVPVQDISQELFEEQVSDPESSVVPALSIIEQPTDQELPSSPVESLALLHAETGDVGTTTFGPELQHNVPFGEAKEEVAPETMSQQIDTSMAASNFPNLEPPAYLPDSELQVGDGEEVESERPQDDSVEGLGEFMESPTKLESIIVPTEALPLEPVDHVEPPVELGHDIEIPAANDEQLILDKEERKEKGEDEGKEKEKENKDKVTRQEEEFDLPTVSVETNPVAEDNVFVQQPDTSQDPVSEVEKHKESITGVSEPTTGTQEEGDTVTRELSIGADITSDTTYPPTQLEAPTYPPMSSSLQTETPPAEPEGPNFSSNPIEQTQEHRIEMELPKLSQSPNSTTHEMAQEHMSIEESQQQRTPTPIPAVEPEEINPDQESTQESLLPGPAQNAVTPVEVEVSQLDAALSAATDESILPAIPETTQARDNTMGEAAVTAENNEPEYESIPMQSSLSEGSKRKSKKARQREKKRRSLQGIDVSGSLAAAAEMVRTPSIAEEPSGVSVVIKSSTQQERNSLPVTTTDTNGSTGPIANMGNTVKTSVQSSEHINRDLAEEDKFSTIPEADFPGVLNPIPDNHQGSSMADLTIVAPPPPFGHQTPSLPAVGPIPEDLPALPPSEPPSRPGTPTIIVDPPSDHTPLHFPERRSARKDVEHLRLPPTISRIPSNEGLPLLSPDLIADNGYTGGVSLQLEPEIPFISTETRDLGRSNGANASLTINDPDDEDPSLSSFGDGAVQAIPVAQVGLRSPMFPSGSKPTNLLGAMETPTKLLFSQQSDSVGTTGSDGSQEPAHDPSTNGKKDRRGSVPSVEDGARIGDGEDGQKGEKSGESEKNEGGEEGIEHEEDHSFHNKTVITTIENEVAQSNDENEESTPNISHSLIQHSVSSEEADPVSKEQITNTYHTANAEDLSFQSSNKSTVESSALPPTNPEQSPLENHIETSISPPPPLTHSSSFGSAIEFWKRQISIPSTTDLIPSPQLSPSASHSDTGVPLPISILSKSRTPSIQPIPLIEQVSEPLAREVRGSSSDSDTTTGVSIETATASQTQFEVEINNQQSISDQDPEPSITVEADPPYQVSVEQILDKSKPRPSSINISVQNPGLSKPPELESISRRGSLQTQNSYDSLRTVITHDDRAPSPVISETRGRDSVLFNDLSEIAEGTENPEPSKEDTLNKTYESLFGHPSKGQAVEELFVNKLDTRAEAQPTLDSPFSHPEKPSVGVTDNLSTSIKFTHPVKSDLSTNAERNPQGLKHNPDQPSTGGRRFISADDLLARLPVQPIRKLTPIPSQSGIPPKVKEPSDRKLDMLKRGERRRPTPPSLRRAGSQLESPHASSEHVIFGGERYQTPDSRGKGKDTLRKADVFEAWGDKDGEPKSPTRPPSIRRRQSMQIVDLENRLESLAAENTNLIHEKANIEKTLTESIQRYRNDTAVFTHELENGRVLLTEKDSEITVLKKKLEHYRQEAARLSQANDSLKATNTSLSTSYKFSYAALAGKYERKREQLTSLSKEHSELQASYSEIQATMETVIKNQLQEKDLELKRLRGELAKAREEVQKLQQQATTRQDNKYLDTKDLQHFSNSCQQLYSSLKIWCNQFSSFSAGKKCIHVHRLKDEAARDRIEDVMLDDRGVRKMLKDERMRPEVFMAITMRMIWEHVFTRYLFGLEVDERQKLLSLEKTLAEVGEHEAVHQWRATTLTLLSTRSAFEAKRTADTEEIVKTILDLLKYLLPPPSQYNNLALESLRNLVQNAVQLAIEMRTQRAEYVMKRPPRPEYDDNGEVINSVPFKAFTMQNRGTEAVSERELEAEGATVKMVLFPQVIRRGNEYGENYGTEVTVLPMQVLVNRPQLKSESRASNKSFGSTWRDEQQQSGVSRLTPITDQSPGDTPRTTPEKQRLSSSSVLPMIPEQTIRLVSEDTAYQSPSAEKI